MMLERDDGRWTLVGTVSNGIGCANPNMPGIYMRMSYYRPWIERVTGLSGEQLG
jgi:secreted trypsin-like serine protease